MKVAQLATPTQEIQKHLRFIKIFGFWAISLM
jgi:hypothetical protein